MNGQMAIRPGTNRKVCGQAWSRLCLRRAFGLFVSCVYFALECSSFQANASSPLPVGTVRFFPIGQSPVSVLVEIPRTEEEFSRGLMFRENLLSGQGMLFIFQPPKPVSFWMKDTWVSLDMIFVDAQSRVVWIEERTRPLDNTPKGPPGPVSYVVEVPAGFCQLHRIQVGTLFAFSQQPTLQKVQTGKYI